MDKHGTSLIMRYGKHGNSGKRLEKHDIMPKWTQKETDVMCSLLKDFLQKKSSVFQGALREEGMEDTEVHVVDIQPFEDRIEFAVKPFPSTYSTLFFSLMDKELKTHLPGFQLTFHSQTHRPRKRTFISAENNDRLFEAKVHSEGFEPYFVYRRQLIKDYLWMGVLMILLSLIVVFLGMHFCHVYQSHGYGILSGIREVFRALLF